ncbi:MAG: hypothetical protein RMM53_07385, partial [Bacteroidia bacterium]|nr:hypothetical protein [Bacteroidia bacterium]
MPKYIVLTLSGLAAFLYAPVRAQVIVVNKGEEIRIEPGCLVGVHGGWWNQSGKIYHSSDSLVIFGDIVNDDPDSLFSSVMNETPIEPGALILAGGNQTISTQIPGTTVRIPILRLRGTGVKTFLLPAYINDTLDLHNRLLDTRNDTVFVLNRSTAAILRADSGMVRSDEGGALHRRTHGEGIYLFPVGDVSSGEWIYRPLTVEPTSPGAFAARMVLGDATSFGYNRSQTVPPLCRVAPRFFHRFWGSTPAHLSGFYAPSQDAYHERWARWNGTAWETFATAAGATTIGVPVAQTLHSYRRTAWQHPQTQILNFGDAAIVHFPPIADQRLCADDPPINLEAYGNLDDGVESFTLVGNNQTFEVPGGVLNPSLYPPGQYQAVYTFSLTDDAGHVCSTTMSRPVQIDSLPTPQVQIVGSDTFCYGENVSLIARPEGYEYVWILGDGQTVNGASSITLNRSETVRLRLTDPRSKCDAETTLSVFRGPRVEAVFSPPVKFCSNDPAISLEGTGTPIASAPMLEYYLVDAQGQRTILESNAFHPSSYPPGTYTLGFKYGVRLGNTQRFCTDSAEKTIRIHPAPMLGYTVAEGSLHFCQGGSVTLEAQPPGMHYRWNFTHDGINFFNVYTRRLTLSLPTTATLTVTDPATGCSTALGTSIQVGTDPFPGMDLITEPPPPFCEGRVTLKVVPQSPEYIYRWYRDSTLVGTEATLTTTTPGRYYAVITLATNPECVAQT